MKIGNSNSKIEIRKWVRRSKFHFEERRSKFEFENENFTIEIRKSKLEFEDQRAKFEDRKSKIEIQRSKFANVFKYRNPQRKLVPKFAAEL